MVAEEIDTGGVDPGYDQVDVGVPYNAAVASMRARVSSSSSRRRVRRISSGRRRRRVGFHKGGTLNANLHGLYSERERERERKRERERLREQRRS